MLQELMTVAGTALQDNITSLGPSILPMSEQIKYLVSLLRRKITKKKTKIYTPNFKKAVKHFCIHAGKTKVL